MSEYDRILSDIEDEARAAETAARLRADEAATSSAWDELAADPDRAAPPSRRFKDVADLSAAEHLEHMQTGELPETDTFRKYRAAVLEAAGLPAEAVGPKPLHDMTVADHLARLQRRR